MVVDIWVYPLISALGRSFKEGNDKSNLVHISSEGNPIIVELGIHVIDEPSQVLQVFLKRLNVKRVGLFLVIAFLQSLQFLV
jgi:hypothetical protein